MNGCSVSLCARILVVSNVIITRVGLSIVIFSLLKLLVFVDSVVLTLAIAFSFVLLLSVGSTGDISGPYSICGYVMHLYLTNAAIAYWCVFSDLYIHII